MRYASTRFCNNLDEIIFPGEGQYEIPVIKPEQYEPVDRWIGFNEVKTFKMNKEDTGIHFFVDDYQFERIWGRWKYYAPKLSEFSAVMTPDWSYFNEWPFAARLWNHYRKHYIGAYLQWKGVKVYPTICWGNKASYDWCFDGEPVGGTVCVSSVGTQKDKSNKLGFLRGYEAMCERLQPETIIFYGKIPSECMGNIVHVEDFGSRLRRVRIGDF